MLTPQEIESYFTQIGIITLATRGEWRDARCPWHDDKSRSFSFNAKSGGWKCQAGCGHGGLKEAAERSSIPFPRGANGAGATTKGAKTLEKTYDYRDEHGTLVFQVCRYRTANSKTFLQRHPGPDGSWLWKMEGVRAIPYRLHELIATTGTVYVVEGEKDADALAALGIIATTNHGGAGKWRPEHAKFLTDRRVVIIPDNDDAGRKHAAQVAAGLQGIASDIRILTLPGLPEKGDTSDWLTQGGTKDALEALADAAEPWAQPWTAQEAVAPSQILGLGYAEGRFFYLPRGANQVVELTASGHSSLGLLSLAPITYWHRYDNDMGRIDWQTAASTLMQSCIDAGVFDPSRIRGRGAWHDKGRPVVHIGDAVIIAGERHDLGQHEPNGYIYPAAIPLRIEHNNPISADEATRLSALCDMLSWERPINGRLLAGWLALAPICGALAWRPHIWITGAAGTGKSWVMDNLMRPVLGRIGLFVQSETTEAGIRQALGYDARPVLFDEAEGESERSQVRMQNVMALMRQASSENGSVIVKGSTTGTVKTYCVRSCFAFSSIGVGIKQHSDSTRITVLPLIKPDPDNATERFKEIRNTTANLLTPEWIGGLHARMIGLIPIVRDNAITFATSAARKIGSQRMGDQTGALLAGAYALHSNDRITSTAADAWVNKQDWAEQSAIQETPDETLCYNRILQHLAIVPGSDGRPERVSVGELIEMADTSLDPQGNIYRLTLMRLGIRVDTDSITIANQHSGIQAILAGTPWLEWSRILRRLPGAIMTSRAVRFAGVQARGVIIPMTNSH